MPTEKVHIADTSPFHSGELELQERAGKREAIDSFARIAIRPYMPDQHREFFSQLPFMVIGSVDAEGWPWASIVSGKPGFIQSSEPTMLEIAASVSSGDPLESAIKPGVALGLLGIEMPTRRRNRLNVRVVDASGSGLSLHVDQSFGNCPQYIQTRSVDFVRDPAVPTVDGAVEAFSDFDDAARSSIAAADTFFVSSYIATGDCPHKEGVDVSHRGGRPGFVKLDGKTLTIPDYSGNFLFNTLGNFLRNPKAGLIFPDFETGNLLMLTGTVELLWEEDPEVMTFKGAERAWRFTLVQGLRLQNALPFRSRFGEYSRNSLMTGNWSEAAATLEAETLRDAWRPFRLLRVEKESSEIRSFYFEPADGSGLLPFEAGQFLTLRVKTPTSDEWVMRTYTVSSSPGDRFYRISVKREINGVVSRLLHDSFVPGDIVEVKAPVGDFYIEASETRPAVLLAGGIGITPMISMARHVVNEGIRTRNTRALTVFHAAQTTAQRSFATAFRELESSSSGALRYYSFVDQLEESDDDSADVDGIGYITAEVLRDRLRLDDYDFYLCGPPPFMQSLYNTLRIVGVRDIRIHAEAFGPASLVRQADESSFAAPVVEEAENAVIKFSRSGFEQPWSKGESTILEVAEAHGLMPEYGCRSGHCGSCAATLESGSVSYRSQPTATIAKNQVLVCCAVPALGSTTVEIAL